MRFGCLILLMFVVLACGQEKKKETVNPLAYAVITGHIKNRQVYPQQSALKVIIPSYWNAQTGPITLLLFVFSLWLCVIFR